MPLTTKILPPYYQTNNAQIEILSIILNQTSTNDPVQTVLLNSMNQTITWARDSGGVYIGTLTKNMTEPEKTQLLHANQNNVFVQHALLFINELTIQLTQYNFNTAGFVDGLINFPIQILWYKN